MHTCTYQILYLQGVELVLTARDCSIDADLYCGQNYLIDTAIVPIDTHVGTSSSEQTYTGDADIAQFNVSFTVRCDSDQYGGDCNTTCPNYESCEECGLPGFTGEFCQSPATNCSEAFCSGNGECRERSPTCDCHLGYAGDFCQFDINECEGVNCSGNGRCEDEVNGFTCVCDPGHTGESCESVDPCFNVSCSGHGVCMEQSDVLECTCDDGYMGTFCEQEGKLT